MEKSSIWSERKSKRKLVDLDKIVEHETSPSNPPHVTVANEVHCTIRVSYIRDATAENSQPQLSGESMSTVAYCQIR